MSFAPGSPSLDWTLSSTRANVRGCRRIQGLAGTSFWTVWTSPAYGGSGSRPFGAAPPRSLSRVFLCRVLAYERQCRTHGGLSAATWRALAAMANGTPGNGAAAPAGSVSAGTHLVREWNGRTYQVEVIDNGYRFDGKTYPSLTTIAKRIAGTHWSGPRFFGLTRRCCTALAEEKIRLWWWPRYVRA